jgi:hypothetical protein
MDWVVTRDPAGGRLSINRVNGLGDIAGNQVRSLREDREGNIWAGTLTAVWLAEQGGVDRERRAGWRYRRHAGRQRLAWHWR